MIEDILRHHGIKGQKWGRKNGPPYPIKRKIKSGTKINSVSLYKDSNEYKKRNQWMYTYNPNDKWDSKVYKGPFSVFRSKQGREYIYDHAFEVVKDLKMPTHKERVDSFIKLYSDNMKLASKEMKRVRSDLKANKIELSENAKKVNLKKPTTKADYMAVYELFNHAMENVNRFVLTKKYAELMSKSFDAMVDDNNKSIYNEVNNPIIIFRANEALRAIGNARLLDIKEMMDNVNYVKNELKKKGKKILL